MISNVELKRVGTPREVKASPKARKTLQRLANEGKGLRSTEFAMLYEFFGSAPKEGLSTRKPSGQP